MKVIINAEDLGLSESINNGIIDCFKQGLITSASLFVNAPFTQDAVEKIKQSGIKAVGVHLNLTYGCPVCNDVRTLIDSNGKFHYVCTLGYYARGEDCLKELNAQVEKFLSFGLAPTHLDYHHYFHQEAQIFKAYVETAKKYNLPARGYTEAARKTLRQNGIATTDAFSCDFHDYNAQSETLAQILAMQPAGTKMLEIQTMPGYLDDYTAAQTNYLCREDEIKALKSAKENGVFEKIKLTDFSQIK